MTVGQAGDGGLPAAVEAMTGLISDDAMFVVGPDHRIVYLDARAEFLTGLAASEALGSPLYEALAGEREDGTPFCARGCPLMRLARSGRSVPSYEARLHSTSGAERWVSVTALVAQTAEGPYLVKLLRDSQRTHETLQMARALIRATERQSPGAAQAPELTPRQLEVLGMLSRGGSAKSIAADLGLAEATVRGHIQALLQAFGVGSQIEAIARAREAGLLMDYPGQ